MEEDVFVDTEHACIVTVSRVVHEILKVNSINTSLLRYGE